MAEKRQRSGLRSEVADFEVVGDKVISRTRVLDRDGKTAGDQWQVFTIHDGRIVDWQGARSRRAAERFAHPTQLTSKP